MINQVANYISISTFQRIFSIEFSTIDLGGRSLRALELVLGSKVDRSPTKLKVLGSNISMISSRY